MASNDTELKLKLAAEGGAASAKEVGSVKEAAAQLADVMAELRAEMLDAGKSIDETEAALAPLQEQLNAIVDAMSDQAEQEAATEALREQAKAMADAAQAAATLRAEQEEAAAIAKAQADAFEAEQAELKRLAEAYDAAQIAAAELAAKQAEQAEAEKAKEIKNQQTALENLGKSVRAMIPGYSALMERVTRLREAWRAAGAPGASFGDKLMALSGGRVAAAIAAFAALSAAVAAYRARLADIKAQGDSVDDTLANLAEETQKQADAAAAAASNTRDYGQALEDLAAKHEANAEKWRMATDLAETLAKAQEDLARATIDARVASGEISKEEGAALKYQEDIKAIERELATERERAALERSRADETARLATEAERAAAQKAAAAEADLAAERERIQQNTNRAQGLRTQANQIGAEGASPAGIIAALGGEEAVRQMIADLGTRPDAGMMDRFTGELARLALQRGNSVESIVADPLVIDQLTKDLNAQAATAAKAAEERKKSEAALAEKVAAEKELLEATREELAAAKASAEKAKAAQSDVAAREQIARDYTIPAMETRADSARTEAERAKAAENQKTYDDGRKEVDREMAGVAKQVETLMAAQGPGFAGTETGAILARIAELAKGGTDYNESGTIRALLEGFQTSVNLQAEAKAQIAAMEGQVRALHGQLKQLESQNRNNPSR